MRMPVRCKIGIEIKQSLQQLRALCVYEVCDNFIER